VDAVTRAVEAASAAIARTHRKPQPKADLPKSADKEWVPLWVPQQESKIASC